MSGLTLRDTKASYIIQDNDVIQINLPLKYPKNTKGRWDYTSTRPQQIRRQIYSAVPTAT